MSQNKIDNSVFLNTFNTQKVLDVYDEIISKNLCEVNESQSISREDAANCQMLKLSYVPMFNLMYMNKYNGDEVFYNPYCTCLIASKSEFIQRLTPSAEYFKLIGE